MVCGINTIVLISLNIAWALDLQLEAVHGQSDSSGTQTYQSTASGGLAVNLRQNGYLVWRFVTSTSCDIVTLAVCYSNDGYSDRPVHYNRNFTRRKPVERVQEFRHSGQPSGTVCRPTYT